MRRRLYTEAEWLAKRPIIEELYIRELRPLHRVAQILETAHNFKARYIFFPEMREKKKFCWESNKWRER